MARGKHAAGRAATRVHPVVCWAVTLGSFAVYLAWSLALPQAQAPDEFLRYLVPAFIVDNGFLPTGWEESLRHPEVGTSYAFTAYGSSLAAVPFMMVAKAVGAGPAGMVAAARLSSVLFGTGTVALCFPLGSRLFKRPAAVVLFALLVGFLPQFAFLSSYFNADAMEVFATALVLLMLMRGVENGWRMLDCALLGGALGVCALSYYFAYGAMLVSIVVYFSTARPPAARAGAARKSAVAAYVAGPLVVLAGVLLVAGWFFARNFMIHDGDFLGMRTNDLVAELYGTDEWKPSTRQTFKAQGLGLADMLAYGDNRGGCVWLSYTAKSFVGAFDYVLVFLPGFAYAAYFAIIGLGFVAGAIAWFRERRGVVRGLCLVALVALPVGLSLYYSWAVDFQPQGRYLMAGLVPLMVFVAKGWEAVGSALGRRVPPAATAVPVVVVLLWVALFAFVAVTRIVPFCTGGIL